MLRGEDGVWRGVVIHDVDDAAHPARVYLVHEVPEILERAVLGVHGAIVADGVGAAERALAGLLAQRVDGHQPDDVHAQGLYAVKVGYEGAEGTLLSVVADENGIHDEVPVVLLNALYY